MMGWQWRQMGHMQIICISHTPAPHHSILMPNQQRHSTKGNKMFIYWFVNTSFSLKYVETKVFGFWGSMVAGLLDD